MLEIIKAIGISIIIPVVGILISKYLDNKITKRIDKLQEDISQIKKELQIDITVKEQIDRLEAVSSYCVSKYKHATTRAVFAEKNRKFIESIKHIIVCNMLVINKWDKAKDILDSGCFYCKKYIEDAQLSFTDEFLEQYEIYYKLFLNDLENLVFSNVNQRIIKVVDLCVTFMRKYNYIAEMLEK